MKTHTLKIFYYIIAFGGIILCMSAAKNDNLFQIIVQSLFGGALISVVIELAWITEEKKK